MSDLAIVIPAYKEKYFKKTLDSLAMQTNKDFTVYIGDDFSPFNLSAIVDQYLDKLTIRYTRFNNNIGAKNLVNQWERCIELVTGPEKWIWLFSDDDIADENCVADFYQTEKEKAGRFDVYRFNTVTIDANGDVLRYNPEGPTEESSELMAYYLLQSQRGNSMPDHIFSREVYNRLRFVFTDYAQGADWAISISFSQEKGMCIIPRSKVYWRYSGDNISSIAPQKKGEMIDGHFQFIKWTIKHFQYLKTKPSTITYNVMLEALRLNLRNVVVNHFKGYDLKTTAAIFKFFHNELGLSRYDTLKELLILNEHKHIAIKKTNWLMLKFENVLKRLNRMVSR
jgi:glycosyltransferase involved in cell wall biosynthesis